METLHDPISAWLSGIGSSIARGFIALVVLLGTEALLYICCSPSPEASTWLIGVFLIVLMPFWWLGYGGWAVVGLLSLIGVLMSTWAFLKDYAPKNAIFALFTCSIGYFWPAFSHAGAWLRIAFAYGVVALLYWYLPKVARALRH